jgi:hypothetical protein
MNNSEQFNTTNENLVSLVDPEKLYPVSYYYHPQRGRVAPPESGMLEGRYLTRPQIEGLYQSGHLSTVSTTQDSK